jgi:hypothetical protein
MSSLIPPESLQNLFNDLDFLSASSVNQKPCFKNRFYVNNDLFGYILRKIDGENQCVNGNSSINSICRNASETYMAIKDNKCFSETLMLKIIEARKGIERIRNTYKNLNHITTVSSINNSLFILDNIIPQDRKIKEGFLLSNISDEM